MLGKKSVVIYDYDKENLLKLSKEDGANLTVEKAHFNDQFTDWESYDLEDTDLCFIGGLYHNGQLTLKTITINHIHGELYCSHTGAAQVVYNHRFDFKTGKFSRDKMADITPLKKGDRNINHIPVKIKHLLTPKKPAITKSKKTSKKKEKPLSASKIHGINDIQSNSINTISTTEAFSFGYNRMMDRFNQRDNEKNNNQSAIEPKKKKPSNSKKYGIHTVNDANQSEKAKIFNQYGTFIDKMADRIYDTYENEQNISNQNNNTGAQQTLVEREEDGISPPSHFNNNPHTVHQQNNPVASPQQQADIPQEINQPVINNDDGNECCNRCVLL